MMMMTNWLKTPAHVAPASAAAMGLGDACWQRALRAAGLSGLMDSAAVGLVLVPSDRAFIDLLHELKLSWAALCDDLPRLRHLLLGHVVMDAGDSPVGDMRSPAGLVRTANQGILQLCGGGGRLRDAQGRQAALLGPLPDESKGYLIDRVLRPAEQGLLELLAASPEHSGFFDALQQTGISSWLAGGGPFTVLAPSNAGWAEHLARLHMDDPQQPAQAQAALAGLVKRHLLAGRWLSDELPWGGALQNLSGGALRLTPLGLIGDGPCSQALLGGSDKLARNGVLHRLAGPLSPHHH